MNAEETLALIRESLSVLTHRENDMRYIPEIYVIDQLLTEYFEQEEESAT